MSFSAGVYTLPGAALNTGDTVSATENNTLRNDMASSFNLTWLRNGTAAATANIPMGGFELTNAAAIGSNSSLLLKSNNGTTAVTIDTAQNVGVGVTPSAWGLGKAIQIAGSTGFLGFSGANGNTVTNAYYDGGNYRYISNGYALLSSQAGGAGGQHQWYTAPSGTAGNPITFTQAMTLDASGNLLVGTTSQVNNALTTLTSSTARASLSLACTTANQGNNVLYIQKFDNTTTTGTVFVAFAINNGGAGSGQINANGSGAAAFGSYSDSRLKENIVDLPSQLSNIMALRPVEFDYIESEGGGHQIGFIAQEMQTIYPDAVGERVPDNMLSITGWSKTEARLVKAIQEQQSLIQSLTDRLTALEGAAK